MKAFVLAAGLGTRLKPWTLEHPKALVPVGGVPMLQRVIERLRDQGFDYIVVNVHHFAEQIIDFLAEHDFGVQVEISDERDALLDTGGAILHARHLLAKDDAPFLIHNVDILSDADLGALMKAHEECGDDATLLVSPRDSSRQLVFDSEWNLKGWHNLNTDEFKPVGFTPASEDNHRAFSGIHVMSTSMFAEMERQHLSGKFSVIDFYLDTVKPRSSMETTHPCVVNQDVKIKACDSPNLHLIDIGKPATLSQANKLLGQ